MKQQTNISLSLVRFSVEAVKALRIEGGDDVEVVSKTKSQLTKAEAEKLK